MSPRKAENVRRPLNDYELSLDAARSDKLLGETALGLFQDLHRVRNRVRRGVEVCLAGAAGAGDIVGSEIQNSRTDPAHVLWVDWLETAAKTLDELWRSAP